MKSIYQSHLAHPVSAGALDWLRIALIRKPVHALGRLRPVLDEVRGPSRQIVSAVIMEHVDLIFFGEPKTAAMKVLGPT